MLTARAMTGGEGYAEKYLAMNDYYEAGHSIEGQWMGRGAELLGLEGAVKAEQFEAIRTGIDPTTGEVLRPRVSADRFNDEGEKISTARNLYDFTISAPKDVSIQALQDPGLVEAHKVAVTETAAEMERLAATRVRIGGANDDRVTSNLVIARYEHDTSRELDPQLHTHLVIGNVTYDGQEHRWKALQATQMFQERAYLTEVYRNVLAREVDKLGYEREDRFKGGKDLGFGIVGIAEETREKFSRRSAQRDAAIEEFVKTNGRRPSDREVAKLIQDTRADKAKEITTQEVREQQRGRMTPEEVKTFERLHAEAKRFGSREKSAPAEPSLAYAREHIFERVTVTKEFDLRSEALRHGRGRIEMPELKQAIASEVQRGAMLTAGGELATLNSLDRERQMVQIVNDGIGKHEALGRGKEFVYADRTRREQKDAIHAVLESRDFAVNLKGAAGTGKTFTLQEIHRGLNDARRSVVAVAPTTSAVDELQKVGFQQAMTISRLLSDPKEQAQLPGQVLIIDEAGMVASKDMAEMLALAKDKGARILFSGDTAQIKSVMEGDALRILESESHLKSASLLRVERQVTKEYKEAMQALRNRPALGFQRLEAMGAVEEVDWRDRAVMVSRAYREESAELNRFGKQRSVLVTAATHDEIKNVTHAIREDRKAHGEIAAGEKVTQHWPLNWTEAQKKDFRNYQPGQVLEFHKPEKSKGVRKNEALEVVTADKGAVYARKPDGKEIKLTAKQTGSFGVFEREQIELSAGDKLFLKANWKEKKFAATNGELVNVASVKAGAIKLEDGRQLPKNYHQFAHGYAVTAHRSQGKTVDFQIIAAEKMARDLFYVSATRGREGIRIITSDSLALQDSIGVPADRQSASELARQSADDYRLHEAQRQLAQRQPPAPEQIIAVHSQVIQRGNHASSSDISIGGS